MEQTSEIKTHEVRRKTGKAAIMWVSTVGSRVEILLEAKEKERRRISNIERVVSESSGKKGIGWPWDAGGAKRSIASCRSSRRTDRCRRRRRLRKIEKRHRAPSTARGVFIAKVRVNAPLLEKNHTLFLTSHIHQRVISKYTLNDTYFAKKRLLRFFKIYCLIFKPFKYRSSDILNIFIVELTALKKPCKAIKFTVLQLVQTIIHRAINLITIMLTSCIYKTFRPCPRGEKKRKKSSLHRVVAPDAEENLIIPHRCNSLRRANIYITTKQTFSYI